MNLFEPCPDILRYRPGMDQREIVGLDLALHIIAPSLVVETGTFEGESARFFSRHARVITMDNGYDGAEPPDFSGFPSILQIRGESPADLDLFLPHIRPYDRWMLFHDSHHTADVLDAEVSWAFSHGALVAIWHDSAQRQTNVTGPKPRESNRPTWKEAGTMLDGLKRLQRKGHTAYRLQDLTRGQESERLWTGLGIAWPKIARVS